MTKRPESLGSVSWWYPNEMHVNMDFPCHQWLGLSALTARVPVSTPG